MSNALASLQIRAVNPADLDEMREYQRLYVEAECAEFPDAALFTLEDTIALLSRAPLGWFYTGYAAYENDTMVGEGLLTGNTTDSLETAQVWVWVPPAERGRGVGSALTAFLVDECRGWGRGVLHALSRYPFAGRADHPYRRFAERHGFALANTEVERRLPLPVPRTRLDSLARQAAPHHHGYKLRTVIGPIPAELAQGYCDVQNRLRLDAPAGDLVVEEGRRTPAVVADQDDELQEQGRTRVTVFAIDAAGVVVAFSCAIVTATGEPHVDQWGTIVRADHRGHRLGLAVKVAQTRAIQDSFPDKRFITTTNAESNVYMVAINEALGFERYALACDFQRILPDVGPQKVPTSDG